MIPEPVHANGNSRNGLVLLPGEPRGAGVPATEG